jgi:hypothetical protein
MFVRAAIDAARHLRQPRLLPYRCDSPTERRRFDMVITPQTNGDVLVEHRLISSEPRPTRRKRPISAARGWRCSQCLSVCVEGNVQWLRVEEAPEGLLAADVCPACAIQLFLVMDPAMEDKHVDRDL